MSQPTPSPVAPVPAVAPQCGKSYKRKVGKNAVEKTYKCQKPPGHDKDTTRDGKQIKGTPHGRVNIARTLDVSSQAVDSFEVVPGTEIVTTLSGRDRGEKQTKIDVHALKAYDAWVAAGKPKEIKDSPQVRYFVDPGEVDDMREMIRKAAEFHHKRAQIGTPVPHQSGKLAMHWRVIDRADATPGATPSQVRSEATADRASGQAVPSPQTA